MNIVEIEERLQSLVSEGFTPDTFWPELIDIYGAPAATLKRLQGASNKAAYATDILWQRKLFFRASRLGCAGQDLDALSADPLSKKYKARILLATDGVDVSMRDTKLDENIHCAYAELNDYFSFLFPLANMEDYQGIEENKADVQAAGKLAKLYDEIVRHNPDWETREKEHDLNLFMTRLLFCMFAEDTGIFDKDLFTRMIAGYTGETGGDVHLYIAKLFDVLNEDVPVPRQGQPVWLRDFPYVNGGLFAAKIDIPRFSGRARRYLVEAAKLDWADINPDIFGSMIQAIANEKLRGDLGMHYTNVPNIMKVIEPLFLTSLIDDFKAAKKDKKKLDALLVRLSKIRVFDPACGSGNFLIIAYRELRKIEMLVYERLDDIGGGTTTWREKTNIKLSNFYGIELADFAAETAKLSLWIAEYQMNQRFKETFGSAPPPLPLQAGGNIITDNALRIDWLDVCPPPMKTVHKEKIFDLTTVVEVRDTETVIDEEVETYICGNPPFGGSSKQTTGQKDDLKYVFAEITNSYKNLDYVAAWYLKGADYAQEIKAQIALVSTNSICQGQHVQLMWPLMFERNMEIGFAHQSFKWKNLAKKNAGVTCVIVCIRRTCRSKKYLFNGNHTKVTSKINPYLIEMADVIVRKITKPINSLPPMLRGNGPTDGGNLILFPKEKTKLLETHIASDQLIRRLYGSQELVKGIERHCLWIDDDNLHLAMSIPPIAERIDKVRGMRFASPKKATVEAGCTPHRFGEVRDVSAEHAIIIPRVTSDNRHYIPIGMVTDGGVIIDSAFAIYDAAPYLFALLSSKLHIVWIKAVCGKLKTDYRYSNTLGYNTFPLPKLSNTQKQALEDHAWEIIGAREAHPGKTIAWLYNPKTMPDNLLVAHQALDETLEKIYIGRPFKSDTERLEHLFKLYAKMTAKDKTTKVSK